MASIKSYFGGTYKSRFIRNVAVVATGTAGAQAISIAFAPIITRLYGPEAFGLLGIFMAAVAVITPIAALSYPIAIVLPKEDSAAKGIARLSFYIAMVMATLVAIMFLVAGDWIVQLFRIQEISSYILLIPLVIILNAWLQIKQQWLIRKKQFKITARVAVLQAFIINSFKAGMGVFKPLAAVLILLHLLGSALHAFMLSFGAKKTSEHNQVEDNVQHNKTLWKLAKKHSDFPLYRAPQGFINSVSQSLPVLLIAAFFGPAAAGFYYLGKRLLEMPSQLISKSVGDVFYPRITEAAHSGENLSRLILKATLGLAAIGFLPFALVIAFGPWLFGFAFGAEWIKAGEYARWLAIMSFFNFIIRPSVASAPILGLQKGLLVYELFSTGSKLFCLYIGLYLLRDDSLAIAIFSVLGALAYISLVAWIVIASNSYVKSAKDEC